MSPRLPDAVEALDAAVRGISGVLDVDQVLQLIVDRVRELVEREYAALGIVDGDGLITSSSPAGSPLSSARRSATCRAATACLG